MDNCNKQSTHLFVLSFTVGSESGLALVAANSERQAFQILQNSGSRNCEGYTLIQCRNIGMICDCNFGLLMESFVNALKAYDAITAAMSTLKIEGGDNYSGIYVSDVLGTVEIEVA